MLLQPTIVSLNDSFDIVIEITKESSKFSEFFFALEAFQTSLSEIQTANIFHTRRQANTKCKRSRQFGISLTFKFIRIKFISRHVSGAFILKRATERLKWRKTIFSLNNIESDGDDKARLFHFHRAPHHQPRADDD